jgi:hypothetical protein
VTDDVDRVEDDVEDVDAVGESDGTAAMVAAGDLSSSDIGSELLARAGPASAMWALRSRRRAARKSSGISVDVAIEGGCAAIVCSCVDSDGDDSVEKVVGNDDDRTVSTGTKLDWEVGGMGEFLITERV